MKLHRNIYLWYLVTFFSYAAFTLPVWVIFNTEVLGLNNTQAFLLGVLPYGLSAVFEVPTGSWADKYGRARTYQLGTIFYILSVASYIFFSDFYLLLGLQVLGGLGLAMQSGSLEALVHDSLPGPKKDIVYSAIHGRKMALLFVSRVITVLLSGLLYAANPKLPFVIATITYSIGLVISLFFKELRTEKPPTASSVAHIKETFLLICNNRALVWLFLLIAIYTFFSEALFALYQPYFKSINIEIGEFGVFYAIISVLSAVGALSITRLIKRYKALNILLGMMLAVLFSLSLLLAGNKSLLFVAIIPSSIAFGYVITLQNMITQKNVSSRHQATALSIASFARTFSFLVSVIALGISLDYLEVSQVNALLLVLAIIATLPFVLSLKRKVTI
jgi:MFS family permease